MITFLLLGTFKTSIYDSLFGFEPSVPIPVALTVAFIHLLGSKLIAGPVTHSPFISSAANEIVL